MNTDRRTFFGGLTAAISGLFGVRPAQANEQAAWRDFLNEKVPLPRPPKLRGLQVMTLKFSRWMMCSGCGLHRPYDHWRQDGNLDLDRKGSSVLENPRPMFIADCPGMHGDATVWHKPGERQWLEIVDYQIGHIYMKAFSPYDIEIVPDPLSDERDVYYVPRPELDDLLFTKKDGYFWKTVPWELIRAVAAGWKLRLDSRNIHDFGDCGKPKAELDRIQYAHVSGKPTP